MCVYLKWKWKCSHLEACCWGACLRNYITDFYHDWFILKMVEVIFGILWRQQSTYFSKMFKRFSFAKCPFCIEYLSPFLMVLDKWGIAQLDPLPCYLSIRKISSVKCFSETRGGVLLGGKKSPKHIAIQKWLLPRKWVQGHWAGEQKTPCPLCWGTVTQNEDLAIFACSPSPAWEVELFEVLQD